MPGGGNHLFFRSASAASKHHAYRQGGDWRRWLGILIEMEESEYVYSSVVSVPSIFIDLVLKKAGTVNCSGGSVLSLSAR